MKYTCKLTIGDMGQNYDRAIEILRRMGIEAVWDSSIKNIQDESKVVEHCKGYDFIIAANERWGDTALRECKDKLKLLVRYGIGSDSVDINAARKYNIPVTILPGCNARAVAEQAVALMLDCLRKVSQQDREVRGGNYEVQTYLTHSLYDKTIGLLGMGNIAKDVVRLLQGFTCRFIAYDIFHDESFAREYGVEYVSAQEVLKNSDVVSVHMPVTPDTYHFINKETLNMMKRSAILINTARGGLVNTEDVMEALSNGTIAYAGLDVYGEPGKTEVVPAELASLENLVLTRHSAANTYEILDHVTDRAIEAIDHFLHKRPITGMLNQDTYDKIIEAS